MAAAEELARKQAAAEMTAAEELVAKMAAAEELARKQAAAEIAAAEELVAKMAAEKQAATEMAAAVSPAVCRRRVVMVQNYRPPLVSHMDGQRHEHYTKSRVLSRGLCAREMLCLRE